MDLPVSYQDPWLSEVSAFVECVEENRQAVLGTAAQARPALSVALAINESLEGGVPVRVNVRE
jgi:hypothetical protein